MDATGSGVDDLSQTFTSKKKHKKAYTFTSGVALVLTTQKKNNSASNVSKGKRGEKNEILKKGTVDTRVLFYVLNNRK